MTAGELQVSLFYRIYEHGDAYAFLGTIYEDIRFRTAILDTVPQIGMPRSLV